MNLSASPNVVVAVDDKDHSLCSRDCFFLRFDKCYCYLFETAKTTSQLWTMGTISRERICKRHDCCLKAFHEDNPDATE
jgi:hypothetical protein